jgi:hypothetical protein
MEEIVKQKVQVKRITDGADQSNMIDGSSLAPSKEPSYI